MLEMLKIAKYRKFSTDVIRASSYQTASEPVVLMIAAITFIDLMVQERKKIFDQKGVARTETSRAGKRDNLLYA